MCQEYCTKGCPRVIAHLASRRPLIFLLLHALLNSLDPGKQVHHALHARVAPASRAPASVGARAGAAAHRAARQPCGPAHPRAARGAALDSLRAAGEAAGLAVDDPHAAGGSAAAAGLAAQVPAVGLGRPAARCICKGTCICQKLAS